MVKPDIRYDGDRWFPTEEYKHSLMLHYQQKYDLQTFIETGTCEGHGIDFARLFFKNAYSIELSDYYYTRAVKKFTDYDNVHLIHGDSSVELPKLLEIIPNELTLFYLDAHCAGGFTAGDKSPIDSELKTIFESTFVGVILIDDMQGYWNHVPAPEAVAKIVDRYPTWSYKTEVGIMEIWRKDAY